MAATAYASLVSLLNTLDQIHTHPLVSTFFDTNQNKYLSEKVNFFIDFVEEYSSEESKELKDLARRIADAAHEAENIVEVHAANRIRGGEIPSSLHNLQKIMEKMKSMKEVIKVNGEIIKIRRQPRPIPPSLPVPPATVEATTMVGFGDYMHKLLDDLTGHDVTRQTISITGMCGIGKTTLTRNLYNNLHVVRHFNIRVWVTVSVSQESSPRNIYLQALSCLGGSSIDEDIADDAQLCHELYKILYNRRYLIILDDVWSVEIWDEIKLYFPENNNGSRIVVTTRESRLVDHIGSSVIAIKFLNEENSWKLFCEKTFSKQGFPPELEGVGKKIVKRCGGLPLAITMLGGFLRKSPRTREYWEKVRKDKSFIFNSAENELSSILHLSYKFLPLSLKSCLLHLGLYPENSEVEFSEVIKLWIGEGLIKPHRSQTFEEVAENYLNDLVDRNLIVLGSSTTQRWKHCSVHDLVRDMCIKIGEKENFFCVQRSIVGNRHFIPNQTMAMFYPQESQSSETPSILHPLMVRWEGTVPFKSRLIRVLCCDKRRPYYALQEVNMRYLRDNSYIKEHDYFLPSLVSRYWSLQTLIVRTREKVIAPPDIWKMPHLRHIEIWLLSLPDPPPASDYDICVLQNLQTLKNVHNLIFTEEVCKRIPNIKELSIYCDLSLQSPCYHLENLGYFKKLELLNYSCFISEHRAGDSLQTIQFPNSLKELTLRNCKLEWSYMEVIASLPHLEFLEIYGSAVVATEWVFTDEEFVRLKHLHILHCNYVTKWIAESFNFPVLEKLTLLHFWQLDEIPLEIGEIPMLQVIRLQDCSESANISAVEILYEQERFDNLNLQVAIKCDEPELLREKIQELGLTCQNLQIECESYIYY